MMRTLSPVVLAVVASGLLALTGCSAPTDATSGSGNALSSDSSAEVDLAGNQYGALPSQSEVSLKMTYGLARLANGGSSVVQEVANGVAFQVSDPLAQPTDQYQVVVHNSDFPGDDRQYVAPLSYDGSTFSGSLSDQASLVVAYSDGSENFPGGNQPAIEVTVELDKLIVDAASGQANWVPLMDPISGYQAFSPTLFDPSKLFTD